MRSEYNHPRSETMRIDHKDKPGEYRDQVFAYVRTKVGFEGRKPMGVSDFVGDWQYWMFDPFKEDQGAPYAFQSFTADWRAPLRAADRSFENPQDRWKLNEDMSLSQWSYIDPMPDYGIDEPTYSEDRFHALVNGDDQFVLFNGDGSIIMLYERISKRSGD